MVDSYQDLSNRTRDLITRLYKRLHKEISNAEQMSVTEQNVLYLLTLKSEMLPSELCIKLNTTSQYMSQVLNRLEELKYILRNQLETDKRKILVSLTESGKLKIETSRREREKWLAECFSKYYNKQDIEIIEKAITLLNILPEL